MKSFAFSLLLSALLFTGCSAPVSVTVKQPALPTSASQSTSRITANLEELALSTRQIKSGTPGSIDQYNTSLTRLIDNLGPVKSQFVNARLPLSGPGNIRSLVVKTPEGFSPADTTFIPSSHMEFRGEYAEFTSIIPGIGCPLVAVKSTGKIGRISAQKKQPLRTLTALLRFEKNTAVLELLDPYQIEHTRYAGKNLPLAANYGAAVMYGLSKTRIDKLGLARLINPGKYADTAVLSFLQPYDPERIPVLFVHGLDSTPATWAPLYFRLLEEPDIRKNYQFWSFSYPSGYPYPYSASILRKELQKVHANFPDHKDYLIVGHSMGSMISRLMVTNVDDNIWRNIYGKSPANTPMSGKSRQILEDSIVFNHDEKISRAVFFSGPHRGSEIASSWIGRLGNKLVKLPSSLADVRDSMVSAATLDRSAVALNRAPSSVDTLSPNNPFVLQINKFPIAPGIPYHSVMGDRGKGDTPNSSDGVVAYWSSHLDGAQSEKIVPSGHGSHKHPEGMEEMIRILRLHLKETP